MTSPLTGRFSGWVQDSRDEDESYLGTFNTVKELREALEQQLNEHKIVGYSLLENGKQFESWNWDK